MDELAATYNDEKNSIVEKFTISRPSRYANLTSLRKKNDSAPRGLDTK